MYVKPALDPRDPEGKARLDLRDPDRNDRLPKDQYRLVPDSDYWMRRRRDGDVVTHASPPINEMEGYEPPAGTEPEKPAGPKILPPNPPDKSADPSKA